MAFDTSMSSFLEFDISLLGVEVASLSVEVETVLDMSFLIDDTLYLVGLVWLLVWAYDISCDYA